MGKRTGGDKIGQKSLDKALVFVEQINYAKERLIGFGRTGQICTELTEKWGLSERTAASRVAQARKAITAEVNEADRQEIVAVMMQQCLKIATEASETRQLSNAIGAMRLYGELVGVAGNHRV